jgi:predicted extracellular nuclease
MRTLASCLVSILAILVAPAFASVQVNETTDVVIDVSIPCTGDTVELEGPLHVLMTYTANGNNISGKYQFQPHDVKGTDLTTGDKYEATGVTQETFKTSLQNGQAELTFVNNFRIIGQGPGNNYLVHETMHVTFNANGVVTVTHDNLSAQCM